MSATKSSTPGTLLYRFDPYEADASRNELRKFGRRVRLEPKPWHLLMCLLQRPGELVTRAELQRAVWGADVFVDFEHGLNVAVRKLRVALNDSVESPKYIETVASEGYRFIATVEQAFGNISTSASAQSQPEAPPWRDQKPQHPIDVLLHSSQRRWREVALLTCVALMTVAAIRFSWRGLRGAPPAADEKVMIVVLPFENLSGDPNQEYLSDGMTEELSERLGNLNPHQIGVIGRTSAMTYKNSHATIGEVGKQLGVGYVVEGSVRRDGSKLRVTAQLIEVPNQAHVWAESYDRDMSDLLQLEANIAGNIAREVGASIALARPNLSAARSPSPEAHEAYLLGRHCWNRRAQGDWKAAEEHFRRAIRLDPQYALAYAGLAECRIRKEEASAAALRAVELDPASAEARIALGWVELYKSFDVSAGGRAFRSAVQLDPNYASAHHSYSEYLAMVGRFEEAIAEKRQAVMLDPLSERFRGALAELLALAGQDDAAVKEIKRLLDLRPDSPLTHLNLAEIHLRKARYSEAIRELRIYAKQGEDPISGRLAYAYAKSGRRKDAERILAALGKLEDDPSLDIVRVEIALGQKDEAVNWLEKRYQMHADDDLLWIKVDPVYDPIRSDARFQALISGMNFPQ